MSGLLLHIPGLIWHNRDQAAALESTTKLWQSSQWAWTERLSEIDGCAHQELFEMVR